MTYRILSLDGGGIYGAFTTAVLEKITTKHPDFIDKVDLIAGTSIGGILALALAKGLTPFECTKIFTKESNRIFPHCFWYKIGAYLGISPFYSSKGRCQVLQELFGNIKLNELSKNVVIPAFEINNETKQWRAKLFHNFRNPLAGNIALLKNLNKTSKDVSAVDVGLSTSAAPIYFPSHGVYIDGGVAENNPTMAAIAQVLDPVCLINNKPTFEEIKVLSIGSGAEGDCINSKQVNWGWISWVRRLFNLFFCADVTTTDYQCKQLLGNRYCRIFPILPASMNKSLDDVSLVPELVKYGRNMDLNFVDEWLELNWRDK